MLVERGQLGSLAGRLAANDGADLGSFMIFPRVRHRSKGRFGSLGSDGDIHGPYSATTLSITPASTLYIMKSLILETRCPFG